MATVKLDYTQWRELKAQIYDTIEIMDREYSKNTTENIMSLLEREKIIRLIDETDIERERTRKPKPVDPNKGKYRVEMPRAILACGCSFDFTHNDDDHLCDYHERETEEKTV
jgi:hypothetical protein